MGTNRPCIAGGNTFGVVFGRRGGRLSRELLGSTNDIFLQIAAHENMVGRTWRQSNLIMLVLWLYGVGEEN